MKATKLNTKAFTEGEEVEGKFTLVEKENLIEVSL